MIKTTEFLLNNIYVRYGNKVFRQISDNTQDHKLLHSLNFNIVMNHSLCVKFQKTLPNRNKWTDLIILLDISSLILSRFSETCIRNLPKESNVGTFVFVNSILFFTYLCVLSNIYTIPFNFHMILPHDVDRKCWTNEDLGKCKICCFAHYLIKIKTHQSR